jgi:predicted transcriptional regulator
MMSEENDLVAMTIEVVASYVAHNTISPDDVPAFIAKTHSAIKLLSNEPDVVAPAEEPAPAFVPAVTVRKSIASREHILSLVDGKPYKTLKRHLAGHGLTPAQYRERYGLKPDYPMVAPAYSEHRREVAKTLGLGRKVKGAQTAAPAPVAAAEAPAPASPKPKATAKAAAAPAPLAVETAAPVVTAPKVKAPAKAKVAATAPAKAKTVKPKVAKAPAAPKAAAAPAKKAGRPRKAPAVPTAVETPSEG